MLTKWHVKKMGMAILRRLLDTYNTVKPNEMQVRGFKEVLMSTVQTKGNGTLECSLDPNPSSSI